MPRDVDGREVPSRLAAVFASREALNKWCIRLNRLAKELNEFLYRDGTRHVDFRKAKQHLDAAQVVIRQGLPMKACTCRAGDDCLRCSNQRWLSATQYLAELAPPPKQPSRE